MSKDDNSCPCGKPVRYFIKVDGEIKGSCNKYKRCLPYYQLIIS